MKKIAVYCGAYAGKNPVYEKMTLTVSHWLVNQGYDLVYGGGSVGLMGILAKTVLADGGRVYGFMPQNLYLRGTALNNLTSLTIVDNMAIRKQKMLAAADVCLALPGGAGTLEEISEAYSWARIGDNSAPCILYNANGYYNLLEKFFKQMVVEGFLSTEHFQKLCFAKDLTQAAKFIADYTPPEIRQYP
ncbi:MAG: TIGR00730 family Rossman fold protein [Liquorilactobacillus nagelii]|uniref:Cytokinin riboside 5'-monophosphate phosphoribohydrolase n=1 Tax=Liquorilactobacillus nagelii TaxID=82688 RepID=A0A3Q8CGI7_9LACO|nr:TIGR00730 family Rossman fold protein [Liquorilactobacillus nagelii]AUJ32076.1 Rossman fold protein, TIGR00730 family [Liquorilactobacillus nagelii]MCC7615234.1 TIGR00730 family Rossman fold protein [Liquorilactobacillus nagelii]MCI1632619.1 TIGR00730 family Rossman fold protein [Liquorilactobacillus nagelii]MCI1920734.1 TIGR00730 family Rossman fold protein [Liquorilactobacillus nagelii]MCI1977632.1 TIGR00730 family Rossman fold protein [Liquorilactobacillus nagelii]